VAALPGKERTPRRPRMSEHELELGELIRRCDVCAMTFALQGDLSKHVEEAHGGREPATGSG
jgi:hypothetical protein